MNRVEVFLPSMLELFPQGLHRFQNLVSIDATQKINPSQSHQLEHILDDFMKMEQLV